VSPTRLDWYTGCRPLRYPYERQEESAMKKRFPLHPKHPERVCWGCDSYCATDSMRCGNGSDRTQHPAELLGDDWYAHGDWDLDDTGGGNPPAAGAK